MYRNFFAKRSNLSLLAGCALLASQLACGKTTESSASGSNNDSSCEAPAAAPAAAAPPACQHTMFSKYQIGAFGAVNSTIIDIALNPNKTGDIGTSFQDKLANAGTARQTQFAGNLAALLITTYGNPSDPNYIAYTGPGMLAAHSDLKITTAQYDKFISEVVVAALSANGVPADDINNCFAPQVTDPNFVASIVSCK